MTRYTLNKFTSLKLVFLLLFMWFHGRVLVWYVKTPENNLQHVKNVHNFVNYNILFYAKCVNISTDYYKTTYHQSWWDGSSGEDVCCLSSVPKVVGDDWLLWVSLHLCVMGCSFTWASMDMHKLINYNIIFK